MVSCRSDTLRLADMKTIARNPGRAAWRPPAVCTLREGGELAGKPGWTAPPPAGGIWWELGWVLLLGWVQLVHGGTAYGSLNNFDTVNDNGVPCHGFEIELEDLESEDINE